MGELLGWDTRDPIKAAGARVIAEAFCSAILLARAFSR